MNRLLIITTIALCGCSFWQDDNPVEEAVECAIQKTTGADVDLTPKSPEKLNGKTTAPATIK